MKLGCYRLWIWSRWPRSKFVGFVSYPDYTIVKWDLWFGPLCLTKES